MKKMRMTIMSVLLTMVCGTALAENKMTAEDVTIKAGETAELTISIENDMNVAAFDFRLYLPSGISVVWDDELEDYAWNWCDRVPRNARGSFFDMNIQPTDDGGMLFGANSGTSGRVLSGSSGPVLTITLHAAAETPSGTGRLELIAFSNEDGTQSATPENATFNITVIPTTGINDIKRDAQGTVIHNLAGQRLSKTRKGVNIRNGKKMLVK